jgi:hypothetical protein
MSITIGIVDVLFVQADAVKKGRCLDSNWREDLYQLNRSRGVADVPHGWRTKT